MTMGLTLLYAKARTIWIFQNVHQKLVWSLEDEHQTKLSFVAQDCKSWTR
jgi:hypothetical protein